MLCVNIVTTHFAIHTSNRIDRILSLTEETLKIFSIKLQDDILGEHKSQHNDIFADALDSLTCCSFSIVLECFESLNKVRFISFSLVLHSWITYKMETNKKQ